MIQKKNPKIDLKNHRILFFQIGMLVALTIVLAAFQYSTQEIDKTTFTLELPFAIPDELIPITRRDEPKPPEPPIPKVVSVIEIVETGVDFIEDSTDWVIDLPVDTYIPIIPIEDEIVEDEPVEFYRVEQKPLFVGGDMALLKYLASNTMYPAEAINNGIQGRVYVSFIIGKQGEVNHVSLLRPCDPILDKEALRVVRSMPDWKPGKQRGKPVEVKYNVPINFRLN